MIYNRYVTRKKIGRNGGTIFILLCTLAIMLRSVVCVSEKNSLPIKKSNSCGGEFIGYQYTIGSPNYPDNYPENEDCVYTLLGNRIAKCDQMFHLQFLDFSLPPSENCQEDYLEIGDRSIFCGNASGIRRYPGKNNSLTLRFHSGAKKGGKGFKILVTTSPCDIKIERQNDTNVTKRSPILIADQEIPKNVITKKFGDQNDPQKLELFEAESSYPVYQPEIDFTVEDNRQSGRGDRNPFKIESIDKNIVPNGQENFGIGSLTKFELPVNQNQLFRDTSTTKVSIVTPTPIKYQESVSPKISAYLFVPPASKSDFKDPESLIKPSPNVAKLFLKNSVDNSINPPATEFILPNKWTTRFRDNESTNNSGDFQLIQPQKRLNQKFIVPARSYGIPVEAYYPPAKISETSIKPGEVLDNPSENLDCQGKDNFQTDIIVTENFHAKNPAQIDIIDSGSRANYYPATTYGAPGLSYPPIVPKVNVAFTPSPTYGVPTGNYPGGSIIGTGRPNDWIPTSKFVPSSGIPSNNGGNRYPNYFPNPGIGSGSIYSGNAGYSRCCKSEYSAQRFLLASPGFPSLFYSGNAYECVYSIRPFSSNICQIRLNFHYFNHGTEDNFCTNGYVEIDGRRFCGCKRGLSIVSPVSTIFPKTIGVRYSGYPKTKFNGFLIEVIQEICNNNYPYLSRSKKDVGNVTHSIVESDLEKISDINNSSSQRQKRNLGYLYPKPTFGLNEEPAISLSWNSGNSGNGGIHQLLNQGGISGSIFAPISSCQTLSFLDWVNAAKDVYLRGARCIRNGGSSNIPGYPGGWVPGYPGGGSGIIIPGYPPNGGTINPGFPGNGGTINPGYPGTGGTINPGYPGTGGTINPGYPGTGGTINPGYPGTGGTINPGYPGTGGTINPGYPGTGGTINPGYPGTGGTINPGYPGAGGTINPGYPGTGGTINPGYPGPGGWNNPSSKCEDINVIEGIISSPQYPGNYPNNVNKCYRFYKTPTACQLEVAFLDFDLENSSGCSKDYVAFRGQNRRYCGRSLAGSSSLIDISRTNIVDMYFVSDGYGTGRGFSVGFSQISCRGQINRQ